MKNPNIQLRASPRRASLNWEKTELQLIQPTTPANPSSKSLFRHGFAFIALALAGLQRRMAFSLLLVAAGIVFVQPCEGQSGTWAPTGNLNIGRVSHTATLLANGKVLVVGGAGLSGILANAELYDPQTGIWNVTGSLSTARRFHTATLLPNGMVLVVGGSDTANRGLGSAELYDPQAGIWSATGSLNITRFLHTATLLANGTVLVAGGAVTSGGMVTTTAELYDPALGTWSATDDLNVGRYEHTATLLSSGIVLVAGGIDTRLFGTATAELYEGGWVLTGPLNNVHYRHTATLLSNGMALVAGGLNSVSGIFAVAELYDPGTGTWSTTGSLNTARYDHTATLLPSGMVLVAAGHIVTGFSNSAELYDPALGSWSATGSLNIARYQHTATLLSNGKVLVVGGSSNSGSSTSAELYTSSPPIRVTLQTNPAGLTFTVDGTTYTAAQRLAWAPGSSHTIATTSPQSGGTSVQYVWTKWSDNGAISHTVAPTTNTTYTAAFRTQYFLTMTHGTGGRVSPSSGWKNSGAAVSISATPANGYSFSNWTGTGSGSYSGPNNPASITMAGPITETATFTHN